MIINGHFSEISVPLWLHITYRCSLKNSYYGSKNQELKQEEALSCLSLNLN